MKNKSINEIRAFVMLIVIILLHDCAPKNKQDATLTKLSIAEIIERIKNNQVDLLYLKYRDSEGNELSDSLRKQFNKGELFRDFYEDENGKVIEIRLKTALEKDIFDEIQIRELLAKPFLNIESVDIDCNNSESIIAKAYESDQSARQNKDQNLQEVDSINQQLIISLIKKCGWPDTDESIIGIWYVIQHANSGIIAYYYPKFKQFEKNGLLPLFVMPRMEDRLLMSNGFPQIYGSQIVGKNVYKMRDPINVNKRRKSVGLGTIEENTLKHGFEFKMEDYLEE